MRPPQKHDVHASLYKHACEWTAHHDLDHVLARHQEGNAGGVVLTARRQSFAARGLAPWPNNRDAEHRNLAGSKMMNFVCTHLGTPPFLPHPPPCLHWNIHKLNTHLSMLFEVAPHFLFTNTN